MNISLDGARERFIPPNHTLVECANAIWAYRYHSGYTVTLKGPFKASIQIVPHSPQPQPQTTPQQPAPPPPTPFSMKFDLITFDANNYEKFLAVEEIKGTRVIEQARTPRLRNNGTPVSTPSMTGGTPKDEEKRMDEPRITMEKASFPAEPVNAFGVPQATMRCLEVGNLLAPFDRRR